MQIDELPDEMIDAHDSLATAQEIIENAPADAHSDANERCKYIIPKEEQLFKCFGKSFYKELLENRIKYAPAVDALPDAISYIAYDDESVFELKQHVLFHGGVYKVIRQTEPGVEPGNTLYYETARKFKNAYFEFLWQRYLKRIISWAVLHTSIMYRFIRDTNVGLSKPYTEGSTRAPTLKEVMAYKGEALNDLQQQIETMEEFILKNKSQFPNYIGNISPTDCGEKPCGTTRRKRRGFILGKRR